MEAGSVSPRIGGHQTPSNDVSCPALGRSSFRSCANHLGIDPRPLTLGTRWFVGMKERFEMTTATVKAGRRREYPRSKNWSRTTKEIEGPRSFDVGGLRDHTTSMLLLLMQMDRARGRCRVPLAYTTASNMGHRKSVYHRRGRNPTTTPWRGCRKVYSKDRVGCRPRMPDARGSSRRSRNVGLQRMIWKKVVVCHQPSGGW